MWGVRASLGEYPRAGSDGQNQGKGNKDERKSQVFFKIRNVDYGGILDRFNLSVYR